MIKNELDVLIHPLAYDALSYEFKPPQDPAEKAHTLGRLAYAACIKGDIVCMDGTNKDFARAYYSPSWAPGVIVEVKSNEPTPGTLVPVEINLESEGLYLDVSWYLGGDVGEIEIDSGRDEEVLSLPVELGEGLNIARMAVATSAQLFFGQVYRRSLKTIS